MSTMYFAAVWACAATLLLPASLPAADAAAPSAASDHATSTGEAWPTATVVWLANGVRMPRVLLGMGPWCNDDTRCPAPAKPCRDCYNDSTAAADIALALQNGFEGIDTAVGYGSQVGVGKAVRNAGRPRAEVFLQTKVPGCHGEASTCEESTRKAFEADLVLLDLPYVDSVLLHGPPGPHGQACQSNASCAAAVAQWRALEMLYAANKTRSIGVSNYCATCFECLTRSGVIVTPHVNQIQYHAGMPGADPTGLLSYCRKRGIVPQAYSPLGNYATHSLLKSELCAAIGKQVGKSVAQVALRWVAQNNASLCVAASNATYLKEDMDIFSWSLEAAQMQKLDAWAGAQEDPTRGTCV